MKHVRWIRFVGVNGEEYEFEDCDVTFCISKIKVDYIVRLGHVVRTFIIKNLISYEYILYEDNDEE